MSVMKGNRSFTAHVYGEDQHFFWTTVAERNEIIRYLRAAGLRPTRIAKLVGLSKWHIYKYTDPSLPKTEYKLNVRVRTDIYDLVQRYSIRHGLKLCDAVGILLSKGAETINFKPDERQ